jgi:hypothetical protein
VVRALKLSNDSDDYGRLASWWTAWGHPIIPVEDLPNAGYIVFQGPKPIAAAFLVLTNAFYAFAVTFVSNPQTTWEEREAGIVELVHGIEDAAASMGFRKLIIVPEKTRLKEKLEKAGFFTNTKKVYLCVKEF